MYLYGNCLFWKEIILKGNTINVIKNTELIRFVITVFLNVLQNW